MRVFINLGFFLGMVAAASFGILAIFDGAYGFSICQSTGDWFNEECNRYAFEYADMNLLKMGASILLWLPFNFAR